jgi:hypothetical protein
MNEHPIFGKIIYTYTTKEAVADGTLVIVDSKISQEAGIKYPVYLTQAVETKYVQVPNELFGEQDYEGRLWDILVMCVFAAKKENGFRLLFEFICRLPNKGDWEKNESQYLHYPDSRMVTLKAEIRAHDFDDPSPAIFIMKPGEN